MGRKMGRRDPESSKGHKPTQLKTRESSKGLIFHSTTANSISSRLLPAFQLSSKVEGEWVQKADELSNGKAIQLLKVWREPAQPVLISNECWTCLFHKYRRRISPADGELKGWISVGYFSLFYNSDMTSGTI